MTTAVPLAHDVIAITVVVGEDWQRQRFVLTPARRTTIPNHQTPREAVAALRGVIERSFGAAPLPTVQSIDVLLQSGNIHVPRSCSVAELTDVLPGVLEILSSPEGRTRLIQL